MDPPSIGPFPSSLPPPLPLLAATVSFPLTLLFSQALQHAFSITTSDRLPPLGLPRTIISGSGWKLSKLLPRPNCSAIGLAGVCAASIVSSVAYDVAAEREGRRRGAPAPALTLSQSAAHVLRTACLGLLTFYVLGGRSTSITPSSLISRGAYFRESIPARIDYATSSERKVLSSIFKRR